MTKLNEQCQMKCKVKEEKTLKYLYISSIITAVAILIQRKNGNFC